MATKLIHVSDLHVGGHEERSIEAPLRELVERLSPALIVVTGDLTHRGRAEQHERAATFLRGLGPTVLAVPGNHDVPYSIPARFTRPWREFEARWETTEPVFRSAELHVVGLNSARPWRHQSGGLDAAALERAAGRLGEAEAGALRVDVPAPPPDRCAVAVSQTARSRRGHVLGARRRRRRADPRAISTSRRQERREFEVRTHRRAERRVVIALPASRGRTVAAKPAACT